MASTSSAMAQLTDRQWKQDVFLSFGEDTRLGITSMLYDELENRRIKTFKDDHLDFKEGMAISPSILTAIEESRFAIVVLSENYASSTWCLYELTKIVEGMEGEDRFLPLFYHVEPTDVRFQKNRFGVAFTKHEESSMQIKGKVEQWKDVLKTVANHSGWDSKNYESDRELVKGIVEFMCSKVHPIKFESIGCEPFEATKQAMDEVMRAMKDDNVRVIGVHGMGGVGKTTMVKHVGAQAQKDGIFEHVIMANVSQTPDLIKIQGTFADMLRLKLEGSAAERAVTLKKRIMRGNKILLILDDIWITVDLSSIGIPSLDKLHECNSKILFTTRILNVCHNMESQAIISLQVLSEEDAWNLFVKKTRKRFHESTVVYSVARTVARECAGLPLALISVARTLGDKDLDDWKEAARRLTIAQPANPEDDRDVFNCINLSYDFLRPDDADIAKPFFLLCCLFPKNYDILVEDLLTYAIGKGLFQDVGLTINEARAKAHSVVKYLKASSLLLDSEHCGCVRMHSVIRDVAISISLLEKDDRRFLVKAECDLKDWPMVNVRECYSAISLMRNHIQEFPQKLVCSRLQILLLQSNAISVIPKTFFQSPNELRVLDISKTSILSLSPSFSLLTDLRALFLDDCLRICDLSILGKLKKLEILSMRNSCVTKMPKEIGELTNLKMLDVTNACFDTVPSNVISKLRGLEEMYFECGFREWGSSKIKGGLFCCGTGKNAGFGELIALSRLESLEVCIYDVECLPKLVSCNPNWINFNICISQIEYKKENIVVQFFVWAQIFRSDPQHPFRRLSLDTTMNTLPKWFISVVTEKAEILEYRDCRGLKNILVEFDDGRLHGLKYLAIAWCGELDELMNSRTRVPNKPVFENLEELHLYGLDNLKELCAGDLPPGSLFHLKILSVENCNLVNVLLPSSLLHMLQNLEILNCECSIGMEYVFGSEGVEPEQILLTKLTEITLCNLPCLISIWNGLAPVQIFQNLKNLRIGFCQKMNYLLTSSVAECLLQLELLWVENCSELDRVITPSEERDVNKVVIPELKDIYLSSLPNLRGLYCSTTGTANIECPSLEHLYVDECPLFSTPSAPNFHSRNHVQVHDLQHMRSLRTRLWESNYNKLAEISLPIS